jgi:hypothetical protein
MMYLIYQSLQLAQDKSFETCLQVGCTDDVTTYWFNCIENQNTLQGAIEVPEEQEYLLTTQEISELQTQQYMIDNGWFPNII